MLHAGAAGACFVLPRFLSFTAVTDIPPRGRHVGPCFPDVATVCLGVSFLSVKRAAAGGREAAGNHGPRARPSFSGSGPALDHHERTTTAVVVA